jgi:hypothetical protein
MIIPSGTGVDVGGLGSVGGIDDGPTGIGVDVGVPVEEHPLRSNTKISNAVRCCFMIFLLRNRL